MAQYVVEYAKFDGVDFIEHKNYKFAREKMIKAREVLEQNVVKANKFLAEGNNTAATNVIREAKMWYGHSAYGKISVKKIK